MEEVELEECKCCKKSFKQLVRHISLAKKCKAYYGSELDELKETVGKRAERGSMLSTMMPTKKRSIKEKEYMMVLTEKPKLSSTDLTMLLMLMRLEKNKPFVTIKMQKKVSQRRIRCFLMIGF